MRTEAGGDSPKNLTSKPVEPSVLDYLKAQLAFKRLPEHRSREPMQDPKTVRFEEVLLIDYLKMKFSAWWSGIGRTRLPQDLAEPPAEEIDRQPEAEIPFGPVMPSQPFEAVYQEGVFVPTRPLELPENTRVRLQIQPVARPRLSPNALPAVGQWFLGLGAGWSRAVSALASWEWVLFGAGVLIYAITRLWALDRFPIFFFADEAVHALYAEDLIQRGFHGPLGNLFPIYFEAAALRWTPLLSVYFHAVTVWLFGKSILVTRSTSAVISILAGVSVSLALRSVFKVRLWWTGVLFLAITPAWFLHSRTAFETVMMTAFYATFLLFYLLYRCRSPRYLFPALLFGAMTFYTYSNAQVIVGTLGLFLLISDFKYHLDNWKTTLPGFGFGLLLFLPFISFNLNKPTGLQDHLRMVDSYWFYDLSMTEKIGMFLKKYAIGLSPGYWFFPNGRDLIRHQMLNMGHILWPVLPLVVIGVGVCLWRFRSSPYRTILFSALAAPAGAALLNISITRVLVFVVPAAIFTVLGLETLFRWLSRRFSFKMMASLTFIVLSLSSFYMLYDALVNGPLWFSDYGLYGMQYGAKQLFEDAIPAYLDSHPDAIVNLTPTWANGADTFIRFFFDKDQRSRVVMQNIDAFLFQHLALNRRMVLVMTPVELQKAQESPKFKPPEIDKVVDYPDGRPGFYFVRLEYVDDVDRIFAEEKEARKRLEVEMYELDGQLVQVNHSQIDAGQLRDVFDGDTFTLMRGIDANPFIFEFIFPEPRPVTGLSADFGTMDFTLTVFLYENEQSEPVTVTETYRGLPADPHIDMDFQNAPALVSKVRLEIKHLTAGETAKIHIRELELH